MKINEKCPYIPQTIIQDCFWKSTKDKHKQTRMKPVAMPVHPSFESSKNFGAEEKSVFLVYRKINRNKCVLEKQNPAFEDLVTAGGCS